MLLAHRIRLEATNEQCTYFTRAAGTARRVWNWALAEWQRQTAAGQSPQAMKLKKQFNALKYSHPDWLDANGQPWLRTIHRDAHAQPFAHLAKAWSRYFSALRDGIPAHPPVFKKKGRCRDSFYVANDKLHVEGMTVVLPKIGSVDLSESLRWPGRIMGASVFRRAAHWFLSVQVEVPDEAALLPRSANDITGIDLGLSAAAILSSGEKVNAPRPLKAALRRLRIRSRRQSHKRESAKIAAGFNGRMPKGTRLPVSANTVKGDRAIARLHARIGNLRADFTHKLTTRLCRENQAVVIEDLNVRGMLANRRLSRAISDVGFYEVRRQLTYKARRYGTRLVIADRWYPSSKLCSACGAKYSDLTLSERTWCCAACGTHHDRDVNAAVNLQRLATCTASAVPSALPVARPAATPVTPAGVLPAGGGKVTPVRCENGLQDGSGQDANAVLTCTRFC